MIRMPISGEASGSAFSVRIGPQRIQVPDDVVVLLALGGLVHLPF